MFDFGSANEAQKQAIQTVDGPVLITAGPGTGKTFTLVQRAVYMIEQFHIKPEQILIATFTEKAARELITRITNELSKRNISVNLNEMYIGTFHSICLRFLKEFAEYSSLQKNYRMLDDFAQKYMIMLKIKKFRELDKDTYPQLFPDKDTWEQVKNLCRYVDTFSEEMVDIDTMLRSSNPKVVLMGKILNLYHQILEENNFLDFSRIQLETYRMLCEHKEVLDKIQAKVRYFMIDEYQDTNYIQEQLVMKLSSATNNICVVGDDDQGLYRFRGGSVHNILLFPKHFPKGTCRQISLDINYRSSSQIVDFYNKWITSTHEGKADFEWGKFRFPKKIKAFRDQKTDDPAVIKITGIGSEDWHESVLDFIRTLQKENLITDFNQIAFLFRSVRRQNVQALGQFLSRNGVPVYSPRSGMFFERSEIKYALGAMVFMFLPYYLKTTTGPYGGFNAKIASYYESCIDDLQGLFENGRYRPLQDFLTQKQREHKALDHSTEYGFSGLFYQILAYEPFSSMMDVDMNTSLGDQRPARNLAKFTELLNQFESLQGINTLNPKWLQSNVNYLFNTYLRYRREEAVNEIEDESEYAPSGYVSFLTFHQSKGMEFPVVVVGSMDGDPWEKPDPLLNTMKKNYYRYPPFEPLELTKYFDFWRIYYTVFSRAQDLLVLTANLAENYTPSSCLQNLYDSVPEYTEFSPSGIEFSRVKDVNIKKNYSFTSHVSVYRNCPTQYKLLKELQFRPVRITATIFGQIIHETIEDIHRAAIHGEESKITCYNIRQWLWTNYLTLSRSEHFWLNKQQIDAALKQVNRYVRRQQGDWSRIQQAEVDVSLVKPDYIIVGAIDLIRGEGDTVELVDFKSEKKSELLKSKDRLARYRAQLQLYAHIVEERTGHPVSKLHLYCTGEESGDPQISFPAEETNIQQTVQMFDETVHKIQKKEFADHAADKSICKTCDFRFYCHRDS